MKKSIIIVTVLVTAAFSQILEPDSILDPAAWVNPESIFVSDNQFAMSSTHNDVLILGIEDPIDTTGTIDSVLVFLEQYVSDTARASWTIRPYIGGAGGTLTTPQFGTANESVLAFNISVDITGWADVIDLSIGVRPARVGGGAAPDWYADYVYVAIYPGMGVYELGPKNIGRSLFVPTIARSSLIFTYNQFASVDIKVHIYNAMGQRVHSLILDGQAGTATYTVNGLNNLATGVYYLAIQDVDGCNYDYGKFVIVK